MKLTALPYVGNFKYANELRTNLTRAITYLETYGVRGDTSALGDKLVNLLSVAVAAVSAAPRKVAPAVLGITAHTAQPRTVIIGLGCNLAVAGVPAPGSFTVSGVSALTCQLVGRFVVLTTTSDVAATFPVVYTPPGSNKLADRSGNFVGAFTVTGTRL